MSQADVESWDTSEAASKLARIQNALLELNSGLGSSVGDEIEDEGIRSLRDHRMMRLQSAFGVVEKTFGILDSLPEGVDETVGETHKPRAGRTLQLITTDSVATDVEPTSKAPQVSKPKPIDVSPVSRELTEVELQSIETLSGGLDVEYKFQEGRFKIKGHKPELTPHEDSIMRFMVVTEQGSAMPLSILLKFMSVRHDHLTPPLLLEAIGRLNLTHEDTPQGRIIHLEKRQINGVEQYVAMLNPRLTRPVLPEILKKRILAKFLPRRR